MNPIKPLVKWTLRRYFPSIYNRAFVSYWQTTEAALMRLKNLGFAPALIFDAGAYQGDFARTCFGLWPESRVACFEVLPHKVKELNGLRATHPNLHVFAKLLGPSPAEQMPFFQMGVGAETGSTLLNGQIPFKVAPKHYPMTTVDLTVDEHFGGKAPDLLKMDVQGYELEVLKGSEKCLSGIEVILAEINFLDLQKEVPLLSDLVAWLVARDWVAYDICSLYRRPLDDALYQADFMFVRTNSRFRLDKHWGRDGC